MHCGKTGHGAAQRAGADQVNAALVRPLIGDALAQLSAEHRAVVHRSYYLGWTTTQIADELQIAESTVKSRLHIALRTLQLTLQTQPTGRTLDAPVQQRIREHVVPSPETLPAARDRHGINDPLEASRTEWARIFDLSADLLCISGPAYFTRVNPAFERALGYSSQELMSRPFVDFIHPADRSR